MDANNPITDTADVEPVFSNVPANSTVSSDSIIPFAVGETVLATHVVAYDLAPDQSIYYTTGTSVYKLINNMCELLFRDKLIENLALLGA